VSRSAAKTSAKAASVCTAPLPDFGHAAAATVSSADVAGALATFGDLFGSNLDAAAIAAATSKAGAKCQAKAAKTTGKLLTAMLDEFRACKKTGLKTQSITATAALALCLDAIDTDARHKVARARPSLPETTGLVSQWLRNVLSRRRSPSGAGRARRVSSARTNTNSRRHSCICVADGTRSTAAYV